MRGRKRKLDAIRDEGGKSRDHERLQAIDYESRLARRALDLIGEGINADFAESGLAGFTLGKLYLRHKAGEKGNSISREQYNAGDRFTKMYHRYSAMVSNAPRVGSPSDFMRVKGIGAEPDQKLIDEVREEFQETYNAIARQSKIDGFRAQQVIYGVCVENWPAVQLSEGDYGILRETLNKVGKAQHDLDKRRKV